MDLSLRVRGIRPRLVQQSSMDIDADVVATEIGMGGVETTSTRSPRIPVMQILAPPSMREGLSDASIEMAACITLAKDASSPVSPHIRGSPTTRVTLSNGTYVEGLYPKSGRQYGVVTSKGNSNGVVGGSERTKILGFITEP
jgi:hypothetical protein